MAEKNIKSRIVLKHDVASNWQLATGFTPLKGEVVIYDPDATHSYSRFKIGDGSKNVNSLPFVTDAIQTALEALINDVDDKVDAVSTLVGDTKVSEQISEVVTPISTDLAKKLPLAGGTLTGKLIADEGIDIRGSASENPLMVRGIVGSDGMGAVADLFLQYGTDYAVKLGKTGAYSISADGSKYNGTAAAADKLNVNAGSATQPVYFSGGKPVATTYTLGKSVPSDAVFTDTTYSTATTSAAGLMSAEDKTKLNDIATGANKITVDSALSSSSTNPVQNKVVNAAISNLNTLVGDMAVSEQISTAIDEATADDFGIYVQPKEPTNAVAGDIWIDTANDPSYIVPTLPEITATDNGKVLMVVNGRLQLVKLNMTIDANGVVSM